MSELLHRSLSLTSLVCERGAALEQFKHIVFEAGYVRAFNGIVHVQAPSDIEHTEPFAINSDRLVAALRALDDPEFSATVTDNFLVLKRGRLTVRIRRLVATGAYRAIVTPPDDAEKHTVPSFRLALSCVAPFISQDATRPWSVAALLRGTYVYATNNLSLVRYPVDDIGVEFKVPGAAIPMLLELDSLDWIAKRGTELVVGCGDAILSVPETQGDWPDVASFFAARPANIPEADPDFYAASRIVERFADRFVTLTDSMLEAKLGTIESDYELSIKHGKGSYNARLLALVAEHATHIEFDSFPKPVHFTAGPMEGLMVGVA